MAKSLSQVNLEKSVKENEGVGVSDEDVDIAFRMAVEALDGGGLKVIADAIDQSNDPAKVVGQFLAQLMGQLAEQLRSEFNIDPKIFLAKNGWLDLVLDFIEHELGYPAQFSDQIYQEVLEIIKAASSTPDAPNNVTDPNGEQQGSLPPVAEQAAVAEQAGVPAAPGQPGMGGI